MISATLCSNLSPRASVPVQTLPASESPHSWNAFSVGDWPSARLKSDADTIKVEILDNVVDGKRFPAEAITLKRKR
jgi:hypothetical protein